MRGDCNTPVKPSVAQCSSNPAPDPWLHAKKENKGIWSQEGEEQRAGTAFSCCCNSIPLMSSSDGDWVVKQTTHLEQSEPLTVWTLTRRPSCRAPWRIFLSTGTKLTPFWEGPHSDGVSQSSDPSCALCKEAKSPVPLEWHFSAGGAWHSGQQ